MGDKERKSSGSGTGGDGIENEGTGSLRVPDQKDRKGNTDPSTEVSSENEMSEERQGGSAASDRSGSGSTKDGREPGVSGTRGVTGGTEKEGEGHSGPIRSGREERGKSHTDRDRATEPDGEEGGAREGYEDHGGSRDDDGTSGESSGSRPGYR